MRRFWYSLYCLGLLCSLAGATDECPAPPFTLTATQVCWLGFPIAGTPGRKEGDPPMTDVKRDYRLGLQGDHTMVWEWTTPQDAPPSGKIWLGAPLIGRTLHGAPPPWYTGTAPVQGRFATHLDGVAIQVGLHPKGFVTWRFREEHADLTTPVCLGMVIVGWPDPEIPEEAQTLPVSQFRLCLAPNERVVWEAVSP